ncbi:hypothetical protein ASC83_05735 [Acidovorax sp. Root402]|nr:hypothetical protein ASC83_05735 [Acidovorax sp. Root402]
MGKHVLYIVWITDRASGGYWHSLPFGKPPLAAGIHRYEKSAVIESYPVLMQAIGISVEAAKCVQLKLLRRVVR